VKVKAIRSLFYVVALLITTSLRAESSPASGESRFDALAKSVGPLIALGTAGGSAGNHAFDLQAVAGELAGLPPEFNGARIHIAFQYPDKLRVEFPIGGVQAIVCRNGQSVWAFPSSLFAPLVDQIGATVSTKPLPPFQIDEKKAVLLPALLDVHEGGFVKLSEESYRVLDLQLIPEIKTKKAAPWPVRLWILPADHRIAQIAVRLKGWSGTARIEKLDLSASLPDEVWNPSPEQQSQSIAIPGEKIWTIIETALKRPKPQP
jgi:hypothetical protein